MSDSSKFVEIEIRVKRNDEHIDWDDAVKYGPIGLWSKDRFAVLRGFALSIGRDAEIRMNYVGSLQGNYHSTNMLIDRVDW